MKKYIFPLSIILFVGCGIMSGEKAVTAQKVSIPSDWKTHESAEYTFKYPATWTKGNPGNSDVEYVYVAPKELGTLRVNITKGEDVGSAMNLSKYAKLSIKNIKKSIKEVKMIEKKMLKNEKGKFYKLLYKAKFGKVWVKLSQYLHIGNNKGYVITYGGLPDDFDANKKIGDMINSSFVLK